MKISKAVGIDLGTTNSVIAMVGENKEEIVCRTDRSGRRTFPSVVVYDRRTDSFQAGAPAFAKRGTAADPIVSIKSHMGDSEFRASTGPKTLAPIEISSIILREMKRQMQDYLEANGRGDHVVDRAVITIPAYFASNAREATTKAAEDAGFMVEYTLQEPTAAVLFYAQRNGIEDGVFLVYDLGGGTFDVSVVKVDGGDVVVLGIAGNNYLGGDDFDQALAYYLLEDLRNDVDMGYDLDGFDPNHDPEDKRRFARLKLVAESIKKSLSAELEHYEEFANIFADKSGASVNLALEISRETFEGLIRPILESTIDEVHKALANATRDYQVSLNMVDAVLLVGGSTHIPFVSQVIVENFTDSSLSEHTKQPTPLRYEPDMAVGFGAALAAAGTGTAALDDAAIALMTGDETAIENLATDALVLAPTFGPGSGYGGESVVEGTLSALCGKLPDTVFARVTRAAGGFAKEYPVAADGSFMFTELVSENDPEPYACEFVSGTTTLGQATFDAAIRNIPHASVTLSRSYYLETVSADGGTKMVDLMRQGESLPITRDYEFATNPSNNYFVELRFFEEREFLKKVTISFPQPVSAGTPVKLFLSCSLQSKFSARAEAAGVTVDTQFEPSPAPPMPTRQECDSAVREARAKIGQIPETGRRIVMQKRIDRLATESDAAVEEADSAKARDRLSAVRQLVDSIRNDELDPTQDEFEALVRRCDRANEGSEQGSPEAAEEIRSAARTGREAYGSKDQSRLTAVVKDLNAILQHLTKSEEEQPSRGQPPLWFQAMQFGSQLLDVITAAEARPDLPEAFRQAHMSGAADDRSAVRSAIQACTPPVSAEFAPVSWMSDQEVEPHFEVIARAYRKWDRILKIIEDARPASR